VKKEFRLAPREEDLRDARDARDARDGNGDNKKKKKGGQNKAKDRQAKPDLIKLCFALANGEECTQECKYSHDVDAFMTDKGPDVGPECPVFNLLGKCKFGLKCRFAQSHTDEVMKQITKEETKKDDEFVLNVMSRDLQKSIRSNKFDFSKSELFEKNLAQIDKNPEQKDVLVAAFELATKIKKEAQNDAKKENISLEKHDKKTISFKGKSYLAPLTTVGNIPFRRICKGFGVDITCAEMTIANNLLQGSQHEWALMRRHVSEDIFGVQITGNHPVIFTKACDVIQQSMDIDFLDINLGCPVEGITTKGHGSALMERKNKLHQMVRGAISVLDVPLTIKLRTGIRDKTLLAHKLIPQFQQWGVKAVTLHGRSKEQRYTKLANWDFIDQCGAAIDRTGFNSDMAFFGNGDIFNPSEYIEKLREKKVDGLMIGRGALIKPWIFKEIDDGKLWDISAGERLDILKEFGKFGMEHWGSDTMVAHKLI
jgi:tRNA-dihydrouridine synthase 3